MQLLGPVGLPLVTGKFALPPNGAPLALYDAGPDGFGQKVLRAAYPGQADRGFSQAELLAAASTHRVGDLLFGPTPAQLERWEPEASSTYYPAWNIGSESDLVQVAPF